MRAPPTVPAPPPGRGAPGDPANRFEPVVFEPDPEAVERGAAPETRYLRDASRSVLTRNRSPDVGFDVSLNPYRGCEHGCIYCYARPGHEYLGFSAGLDFETRILVKEDAPELLDAALRAPEWRPQPIALSGVTDPYQPVERRLRITRGCLEVLAERGNPVSVITKSGLVARDGDLLARLARQQAALVTLSITTLDADLARVMEPRAAQPRARLAAIAALEHAGVPVGVNVAPVIPGLNDHEIPAILEAAAAAGARWAGYIMLRLPFGVKNLFEGWLEAHFPERKSRVLSRIRDVRGGRLNDPRFGSRLRGSGLFADHLRDLFQLARRRSGLERVAPPLTTRAFRSPRGSQLDLF